MANSLLQRWESRKSNPATSYFVDAFIDAVGPLITFAILNALGVPPLAAMIFGSLVALASTITHTVRRKRLDAFGILVVAEIAVSIVVQVVVRDPRLLLIKPSLYSFVGAVYLAYTAFGDRPTTFEGARPMATKGDPQRSIAYNRTWQNSAPFRRLHRIATLGWASAFFVDAVLRVIIVYSTDMNRAVWLSNVPHTAAIVILVGFSAMIGRMTKPYVEEEVVKLAAEGVAKKATDDVGEVGG